ncbi:PEGA domain-containing protein, partial [bacterium]|nr:PEGA domain-containing protein [bacterium]
MLYIAIISMLLASISSFPTSLHAGIQEEYLPHTHTVREISTLITVLEKNVKSTNTGSGLLQIETLRNNCLAINSETTGKTQSDIDSLLKRINILEMALSFYHDDLDRTEKVAIEIIKHNPAATLSGKIATAELAMWFEEFRENKVGYINIYTQPPECNVFLDGKYFGITPLEHTFAPLGKHEVQISRNGFETWIDQILITNNETETVNIKIQRNTGSLLVWVSPVGTRIKINSKTVVSQTQPLQTCLYPLALSFGLDPTLFSQPVILDAIDPGGKNIGFTCTCYKPTEYKIQVNIGDYILPPLVLAKTNSYITIESTPNRSKLSIDGSFIGRTPILRHRICPGKHSLDVEFENNLKWSHTITISDNDEMNFHASPRDSILFLGCGSPDTGLAIEGTYPVRHWFDTLETWNLIGLETSLSYSYRPVVASVIEKVASTEFKTNDPVWINMLDNMNAVLLDSGASLIVFARLVNNQSDDHSQLFILHTSSGKPDVLDIPTGMPNNIPPDNISNFLDSPLYLKRLRSGLRVTAVGKKIIITDIIPGGPAETSTFQTGDIIKSMDNQPISSRNDFERILHNPDSNEIMPLLVLRGVREISDDIQMQWQPVVLPLLDPAVPYNLYLSRIESMIKGGDTALELHINAGICSLALKRPDLAVEYFNHCNFPDDAGLNNGT